MFVFIGLFIFFLVFAPHLISFSDGAEFAISVATLGISHPPSYPLFITLGKLFYFLPVGSVYFRLVIYSITVSSLIFYCIWKLWDADNWKKIILIIFLLCSDNLMESTLIAEVYGLNLLFFALIYIFFLNMGKDVRFGFLIAFLIGLALGNHQTIALIMPFFVIQAYRNKLLKDIKNASLVISLFFIGLSIYLYLPIRAEKSLWNWGNPTNLSFFLTSLFRLDFKTKGFFRPVEHFFNQLLSLNPINEVGVVAAIAAIMAVAIIFQKDKQFFIKHILLYLIFSILIVILLGYDSISFEKMTLVYAPFFLPAYFILGLFVAESTKYLREYQKYILFIFLLTGFIAQQSYYLNFALTNHAVKSYNYSKSQLAILPINSVLIVEGGEKDFPLIYEQIVKKHREDIKIIKLSMLGKKWNFKESVQAGATYQKGYEGEYDSKKAIFKAVVLFQKEFKGRRVFTNILEREELPSTLKYNINGLFYEFGDGKELDLDFFRSYGINKKKDKIVVDLLNQNLINAKNKGDIEKVLKINEILKKIEEN